MATGSWSAPPHGRPRSPAFTPSFSKRAYAISAWSLSGAVYIGAPAVRHEVLREVRPDAEDSIFYGLDAGADEDAAADVAVALDCASDGSLAGLFDGEVTVDCTGEQ